MKSIRESICRLGGDGLGSGIDGLRRSPWGTLNAVHEDVDHHARVKADPRA